MFFVFSRPTAAMPGFFDVYCATAQGSFDWFDIDLRARPAAVIRVVCVLSISIISYVYFFYLLCRFLLSLMSIFIISNVYFHYLLCLFLLSLMSILIISYAQILGLAARFFI